jgi:hypothetical protein
VLPMPGGGCQRFGYHVCMHVVVGIGNSEDTDSTAVRVSAVPHNTAESVHYDSMHQRTRRMFSRRHNSYAHILSVGSRLQASVWIPT